MGFFAVEGFEAVGVDEGHTRAGRGEEAFAAELADETADGFAGEAGHVAELFVGDMGGEADGEAVEGAVVAEMVGGGPVEECGGELAGGGGGEGDAAGGEDGAFEVASQGLGGDLADVGVGVHEADEVFAGDGLDGAGAEGLNGDAVDGGGKQCVEAEDVAGVGDAEDEETALRG